MKDGVGWGGWGGVEVLKGFPDWTRSTSSHTHTRFDGLQPTSSDTRSEAIPFPRSEANYFLRSEATPSPPHPPLSPCYMTARTPKN